VPRTRPPYPEEFKREAIELVRLTGKSIRQAAKDLWISGFGCATGSERAAADAAERPGGLSSDEREELQRLRRESQTLRTEREILKGRGLLRQGDRRAVGELFVGRCGEGQLSRRRHVPGTRCEPHLVLRLGAPATVEDGWLTERSSRSTQPTRASMARRGSTPGRGTAVLLPGGGLRASFGFGGSTRGGTGSWGAGLQG
jgi:transposase